MVKPTTHAEIIRQWPSAAAFGRAIGVAPRNAVYMATHGIAERHWDKVVRACRKFGLPPVTREDLSRMAAAQKEPRNGESPKED